MDRREQLSKDVQAAGETVNQLRLALVGARMPFVAGIVRAAEEALLVAVNMLDDAEENDL